MCVVYLILLLVFSAHNERVDHDDDGNDDDGVKYNECSDDVEQCSNDSANDQEHDNVSATKVDYSLCFY